MLSCQSFGVRTDAPSTWEDRWVRSRMALAEVWIWIYTHMLGRLNVAVKSLLEADVPGFSRRIAFAVETPPLQGARFDSRLTKLPPLVSEHCYNSCSNHDLREFFSEHHRSATSGTMKAQIPSPGKLGTERPISISRLRASATRGVANRQILDRWLPTGRLRVKLHQVQNVFRHVVSHRQPELARPIEGYRIIMRPCATGQQFGKLGRLFGGILVSEQLAYLVFHLRHGFFGLIGQNQRLCSKPYSDSPSSKKNTTALSRINARVTTGTERLGTESWIGNTAGF